MEKEKVIKKTVKKAPKAKTTVSNVPVAHGVGRRKKAIARVWLRKGAGAVLINGREVDEYFNTVATRTDVAIPFNVVPAAKAQYDVHVNVSGGGQCAQAGAVRLGIARALVDSEQGLRATFKTYKLLTVDSRQKERKKYGQKAARRKFQFVKR